MTMLSLAGCERWELDRQMEALCKKDGGIKVYETVTLPASEFGPGDEPLFKYRAIARSRAQIFGPDYKYSNDHETLAGKGANPETGSGQLVRLHWAIHRLADGKLLGEQVEYRRHGGDLFTFGFQPSSASCPSVKRDVAQLVFIKGT
ncbi:MAG: hypothetical protein K2X42_06850 [Burkholderiaceae bacterium]|nr:hypothetical protein [Burkholderiaceae bacterium]